MQLVTSFSRPVEILPSPLSTLELTSGSGRVSVLGMITTVLPADSVTVGRGTPRARVTPRRNINIAVMAQNDVILQDLKVTLWGPDAERDLQPATMVMMVGAVPRDYNNERGFTLRGWGVTKFDVDTPQAKALRERLAHTVRASLVNGDPSLAVVLPDGVL